MAGAGNLCFLWFLFSFCLHVTPAAKNHWQHAQQHCWLTVSDLTRSINEALQQRKDTLGPTQLWKVISTTDLLKQHWLRQCIVVGGVTWHSNSDRMWISVKEKVCLFLMKFISERVDSQRRVDIHLWTRCLLLRTSLLSRPCHSQPSCF